VGADSLLGAVAFGLTAGALVVVLVGVSVVNGLTTGVEVDALGEDVAEPLAAVRKGFGS
jgi:hypothetical protein